MTAHTEQLVAAPLIMTSTDPPAGHVQNDQNTSVTGTSHVGIECSIKDLYAGAEDNQGRFTWTDKYPEDLEEAAEDYNTIKHAILLRHKKCFNDSRKALEIDSIVIQSPLLKQILGGVLADYPGEPNPLHKSPSLLRVYSSITTSNIVSHQESRQVLTGSFLTHPFSRLSIVGNKFPKL